VSLEASGLASVVALSLAASVAAGADVAAGVEVGVVGVSVAQETNPADRLRLAMIKRALRFIVVGFCLFGKGFGYFLSE
jgi:hypothetical protein